MPSKIQHFANRFILTVDTRPESADDGAETIKLCSISRCCL
uniref:Uncharacterized protein n=1 Tax=Rheinheimera sp. BAL341 TaxID=1708203 RepID=A0A486XK67_9GAMM